MKKLLQQKPVRHKKKPWTVLTAFIVGGGLLTGGVIATLLAFERAQPEALTQAVYPAQEATVVEQNRVPIGHVGMDQLFWEYKIVRPDSEYEARQALLDTGMVTLWPAFNEKGVMWLSAHNPGTFSYVAENAQIGSTITLTTPPEYQKRHPFAAPDVLRYEVVERLETDLWAQDPFVTTGEPATRLYNDGADSPYLVMQYSGEGDRIVLILATFTDKTEGTKPVEGPVTP